MVFVVLFLMLGLVLALNFVNNGHVSLLRQDVTVLKLDKAIEDFPILHLSDLHGARFGEQQRRVKELLRLESYKAVCLTGDMVGKGGDVQPLLELLAIFPDDVPVYLIAGDNDPPPLVNKAHGSPEVKADYILKAEQAGAIYLDSPQMIELQKRKLWFVPAKLYQQDLAAAEQALKERKAQIEATSEAFTPDGAAALRAVDYQLEVLRRTAEAREQMDAKDAYVLLSHFPLDTEAIINLHEGEAEQRRAVNFPGTVSLVLAGHWNNGQWRLPLLGAIRVPEGGQGLKGWLPDDRAISGLAVIHGVPEYISPGLGASGAYPYQPFRLFNRPEMTLLKLSSRIAF